MKICFLGTYDPQYPRNKILIDGLRQNGVEVVECNIKGCGYLIYLPLIKKFLTTKRDYDYVFCAFPVHLSIFLALLGRKPVIVDALISLYDTAVRDRQLYAWWNPFALSLYLLDILTVKIAHHVTVDTAEHKAYFSKWRNANDITVIPLGVHSKEFFAVPSARKPMQQFLVQFHGGYIPLQGIDKIVAAAKILKNDSSIHFRLIGGGQQYDEIAARIKTDELTNVTLIPWQTVPNLNVMLSEADVIFGVFGESAKTNRVIPNKIFQGLAVGKPVITKDTGSVRALFSDNDLVLVQNTPESIAAAIVKLKNNPEWCKQLADNGQKKIADFYREKEIASILVNALKNHRPT
ncbi:MAG: glycosyltransferase [Candidatus Paceibacteria bacterium]